MGLGAVRASVMAGVELIVWWVPTMAWLPSLTDTFWTVTVCSLLLRLSFSTWT